MGFRSVDLAVGGRTGGAIEVCCGGSALGGLAAGAEFQRSCGVRSEAKKFFGFFFPERMGMKEYMS